MLAVLTQTRWGNLVAVMPTMWKSLKMSPELTCLMICMLSESISSVPPRRTLWRWWSRIRVAGTARKNGRDGGGREVSKRVEIKRGVGSRGWRIGGVKWSGFTGAQVGDAVVVVHYFFRSSTWNERHCGNRLFYCLFGWAGLGAGAVRYSGLTSCSTLSKCSPANTKHERRVDRA